MENLDIFLSKVERLAKSVGFSVTFKRECILKSIFLSKNPICASEIKNILKEKYKINISMPTIYSIMRLFEELQILHILYIPSKKTKYYSIKGFNTQNHLVCMKCGKIISFFDKELDEQLKKDLKKKDFILTNHRILLYGTCKECTK